MPAADALAAHTEGAGGLSPVPSAVHGWGGGVAARADVISPRSYSQLQEALAVARAQARSTGTGVIARGMGRSYGDAAQLSGGVVLDTTALRGYELDAAAGTVTAQAGVTLAELLDALVPRGWMVPVVPGTQRVTVAGAIASDIHGKNHGTAGSFGNHVQALGLLTAGGELIECAPEPADDAFAATLGGMGLTGVIAWAQIKLRSLTTPLLSVDTDRVEDLEAALEALMEPGGPHRVAWLDLLSARPVRGVVTRATELARDQAGAEARGAPTVRSRASVPRAWPGAILRPGAVRAFNELRFRRSPRRQRGAIESIGAHMFPLDALEHWPRLYGPRGFLQYQLVVPTGQERALHELIARLRRSHVPCYLAVLKDFGPGNGAPLSFPIAGWTLALDMPRAAPGLGSLLTGFDELVAQAGGRVYLSKDARMGADALRAMYPRLGEWQRSRDRLDPDGLWRSDLALRTGLVTD